MLPWQTVILFGYATFNLIVFLRGVQESHKRKNAYKLTPWLLPIGVFAWGDAVIIGPFWVLSALVSYLANDWILFLLIVSVFWVVRSLGETIYWFNQQFSTINRNPPAKMPSFRFFHNDSIWYIHQISWQCVTIISIITTIYLAATWLRQL